MVIYSCLSSTLLLTVLVSILSNTFNQINRDAIAEQMYRRAVSTFQGVKSDGIFSFQPPINILAFIFLYPARVFMTPHTYHKIIVFAARLSNLPLLLIIRLVERHLLFRGDYSGEGNNSKTPDWLRPSTYLSKLDWFGGARTELNAVFEFEDDIEDDILPGGAFDIHDGVMTPAHVEMNHNNNGGNDDGKKNLMTFPSTSTSSTSTSNGNISTKIDERTGRKGRSDEGNRGKDREEEEMDIQTLRERSRQRRTQSMSDWGGTLASISSASSSSMNPQSKRFRRPTILSKLYGYGSSRFDDLPRRRDYSNGGGGRGENDGLPHPPIPHTHAYNTGLQRQDLKDEDTIRTPNTAGSRLSNLWSSSSNGKYGDDRYDDENEEERERREREYEEERENMKARLERIEEGQKRIEEALKALGGGD